MRADTKKMHDREFWDRVCVHQVRQVNQGQRWEGEIWAEVWMTRSSQLWKELEEEKGIPGWGEGRCQDPEARKRWVCLQNRKKASVVEMTVCVLRGGQRRGSARWHDPGQIQPCGPRWASWALLSVGSHWTVLSRGEVRPDWCSFIHLFGDASCASFVTDTELGAENTRTGDAPAL